MRKIFFIPITTIILLLVLNACRKVDEHKKLVESQPWLAEQYPLNKYGISEWKYPALWVIGDTAMLIGKFFSGKPGSEIRVGGVPVKVVDHIIVDPNSQYTTYGIPLETMDVVRFVITKEMGVGQDRTVTVTANGITINGGPMAIRDFAASTGRTDTTLVVDNLLHWMPENAPLLKQKGYSFVRAIHCDRNGTIWFDNQLSINQVTGGQVNPILNAGDKVTDDKGAALTIRQILGSAISFDGNTLFFSMENVEPSADTVNNYVFRLCKMDVPSKHITTLNRTLVLKGLGTVDEDPAPFQGNIDRMKIVAMQLHTDLQDDVIYTNYYAPGSTSNNHSVWTSYIGSGKAYREPARYNVRFICRLDITGKVTALLDAGYLNDENPPIYPAQGAHAINGIAFVDPLGRFIYGMGNVEDYQTLILKYDSQEEEIIASVKTTDAVFNFHSYDTVPATQSKDPLSITGFSWTTISPYFNNLMVLSDGSLLGIKGASLFNYDFEQRTAFCYAGVENARGGAAAGQDQLIGKAKWVDFTNIALIGQDKTNAVYFCRGAMTTTGVDFYKLHPAGK